MAYCHPLGTESIAAVNMILYKIHYYSFCMSVANLICVCVSDPFAAVFGNESFGGGFADFSALTKVIKWCCSYPVITYTVLNVSVE